MKRFACPLFVLGILVIVVAVVSWFAFPDWEKDPMGIFRILGVAFVGVLAILSKVLEYLEKLNKIIPFKKAWNDNLLEKIKLENIRESWGASGKVKFINRGATNRNSLIYHNKIIIIGKMKAGKTREAAEIIDWAITDNLINEDQIYIPKKVMWSLENSQLKSKIKTQAAGKKLLVFLDEMARELEYFEEEKWEALFNALKCCSEHFVVATGRSDKLNRDRIEWLKKQGFEIVELGDFN